MFNLHYCDQLGELWYEILQKPVTSIRTLLNNNKICVQPAGIQFIIPLQGKRVGR